MGDYDQQYHLYRKAAHIKLLLTDCDGVLTDNGVYYSATGEEMKRFSMRDGMGVERLRKLAGVDVGIVTGENSMPVVRRAAKLGIEHLHLHSKDKVRTLLSILDKLNLSAHEIAYIGDDVNDLPAMEMVGLSACPADAMPQVKEVAHFTCQAPGGHGAFREFAELIVRAKLASSGSAETSGSALLQH